MAAQCSDNRFFAAEWKGYLSLSHGFSVIFESIAMYHAMPKTRFFGVHFCCRQYGSSFTSSKWPPKAIKFGKLKRNNGITSFKVTTFVTNGKLYGLPISE